MASFPTKELSPRFVFASEHKASLEGFGVQEPVLLSNGMWFVSPSPSAPSLVA